MNHADDNGLTPLMYAIYGEKLENAKLLLDCGADVKRAKKDGKVFLVLLEK